MTIAPDFLVVTQHVARNPVCRAVQRRNIECAVRAFLIKVRVMEDGDDAAADGIAAARVLAIALRILDTRGEIDSPAGRVMRGGMEALVALSERRGVWRQADAPAIDVSLQRADDVIRTARATEMQDAFRYLAWLEK